jgi:uncharacterized membrane protein YhaH (DUF805 family)
MAVLIPLAGFAVGLAVGRWWALAAAAPLGAWVLATNGLDGHAGTLIAGYLTVLLALAIAAGVALRRLRRRGRSGAELG